MIGKKMNELLIPVERDKAKLRKTALILLGLIIFGGVWIYMAYEKYAQNSAKDTRPAYVGQLFQNLKVIRQDGKEQGLDELKGKVWIMAAMSQTQPETCERSAGILRALALKYRDCSDVCFLTLVIDPGAPEQATSTLSSFAQRLTASLPQWWVATADPVTLHKYLKDKFKLGVLAHQSEGKWVYDTSLVLVDRDMKLRKAVIPQQRGGAPYVTGFDFDLAAQWDERGVKTGTDKTNVDQLLEVLEKTIEYLRVTPSK